MIFDLPSTLPVGGEEWAIATDYRDVLVILEAFEDPDLTDAEKAYVCMNNLYDDFEAMPAKLYSEAYEAALGFIDHGCGDEHGLRTMDWTQDAPLIFPAVNRAAGFEVRSAEHVHWWTFVGYFMEIHDSVYATVLNLRQKKARGKKLEKHEQDFWNNNAGICKLKKRLTEAEQAEMDRLERVFGRS